MDRLNTKIDMEKKLKTLLAFYTSGKFDEVITRTKPLLKKYPNIIALYNLLALAYNAIGKHKEGIFILEEAIKVESNNIHVLNNLGMIYSTMNHNELANKFLNKALINNILIDQGKEYIIFNSSMRFVFSSRKFKTLLGLLFLNKLENILSPK